MNRRLIPAFLWPFLVVAACGGDPVGRICDLGLTPGDMQSVVASPSLDCTSRTCLKVPKDNLSPPEGSRYPVGNNGLCTSECGGDGDCQRVPESPCVSGFTCGIAVTVGPFCCRRFCICKDYIILPPSGTLDDKMHDPLACDPTNPANTCQNLDGR